MSKRSKASLLKGKRINVRSNGEKLPLAALIGLAKAHKAKKLKAKQPWTPERFAEMETKLHAKA